MKYKKINYEEQAKKFANLLIEMCFECGYEDIEDNEDWYRIMASNYDGWKEIFCRWLLKFGYIDFNKEKRLYTRKQIKTLGDEENE